MNLNTSPVTAKPPRNIINHFTILLDASTSMAHHTQDLIKVTDTQIQGLAQSSTFHDQETRVTIYTFSNPSYHEGYTAKCLIYDKDVLRVPSIEGLYKAHGNTALCDALAKVIADLHQIPEQYGDHSHFLTLITDGQENWSSSVNVKALPGIIQHLPGNWTLAAFVPSPQNSWSLQNLGFPAGNIKIWDAGEDGSVLDVGVAYAAATSSYMKSRAAGSRSVSNLFTMKAPSAADLKKTLTPVTPGSYFFENVTAKDLALIENARIDQFMELKTGRPYAPGRTYYEMSKRERIQDYKQLAIAIWDKSTNTEGVYTGSGVRAKLGLPDTGEVRISPGGWNSKGYKVYILSTSFNRKLVPGTRVLVMR
jgi:hypothetical protein